jgi:ribose transport system ATP-binding protein
LVTHRLDEVKYAADRVTGLRDGVCVGTIGTAEMTESDAVHLILGRRLENAHAPRRPTSTAEPILEVEALSGGPISNLSLQVRPGEIVGLAGLLGSGRTELVEMIFGARPLDSGVVRVTGVQVEPKPGAMRRLGVAFVPEDRQVSSLFPAQNVAENIVSGRVERYYRGGRMQVRSMMREVTRDIGTYHVKTSSPRAGIETLSGGNQQKVVLARWLRDKPRLVLLDEPTQGIDVGAREEIFALIGKATEEGAAVILISSEFEELTRLSHRILVLAGGAIKAELSADAGAHEVLESVIQSTGSLR